MKIETNSLYDAYILNHQKPRIVSSKKLNKIFEQGLDYDKGAIYLKSSIHRYDMNMPIYNGTPTQFEYLANCFDVEHFIKDLTQPWEVQYQASIITGLMYKAIDATNRLFKMLDVSRLIVDEDVFFIQNWIDTYTDGEREWIKPKKIEAGFRFYKIRADIEGHRYASDKQAMIDIEFSKLTYSTLQHDWPLKHLEKKYGSLENAKTICREKHPEIFEFAEKLKGEIPFSGDSKRDIRLANKSLGFSQTPDGKVWHHHHDSKTLMLIDRDLHDAVRHTGGDALVRSVGK